MKKLVYLIYLLSLNLIHANILLQKPKEISLHEVDKIAQEWETQFTWVLSKYLEFTCQYKNQDSGFALRFIKLPIYSYNYRSNFSIKNYLTSFFISSQTSYHFAKPLCNNVLAQKIDLNQLPQLLENKKFIFYVGAGISAGKVATMNQLEESLGISIGFKKFLINSWKNPLKVTQAFNEFCKAAIVSDPTVAHYALHKIAQVKNCAIVTENVDLLHQRAGDNPFFTHSEEFHKLTPSDLQDIEVIVCVGLSHDDCGFLGWYKENNPNGILVALNLQHPDYLAEEDFFVEGDVQIILPHLATLMIDQ